MNSFESVSAPHVRKGLLQLVFSGSYMQRWNDKQRFSELVEIDKQAHKMIVAWMLFEIAAQNMSIQDKTNLGKQIVEGGIFDYLYRLIITDIKPPIFYKIKENKEHYHRLTGWVLEKLSPRVSCLGSDFLRNMRAYFAEEDLLEQVNPKEAFGPVNLKLQAKRILKAAHLFASAFEFSLIRSDNLFDPELENIERTFKKSLEALYIQPGVAELCRGLLDSKKDRSALADLASHCGRLRFQTRWSQTPCIPRTSVLGHLFIVALYAYFFSLETRACPRKAQNNFFVGLFHDLPELMTRDIVSPVKHSVEGLDELLKDYEQQEMEHFIMSPLREQGFTVLADRLVYLLGLSVGSEFKPCIIKAARIKLVSEEEICNAANVDELDPKDGRLLKICDDLSAFIEAHVALQNGMNSNELYQAVWRIRAKYANYRWANVHVGALLADFD